MDLRCAQPPLEVLPSQFLLILCNYCATIKVSSSDEELNNQSTGQTVVKSRPPFETPAIPRSEGTTKAMMQSLGTESAQLRRAVATHAPLGSIHVQAFVRQYTLDYFSNLQPTHPTGIYLYFDTEIIRDVCVSHM